MTVKDFFSFRKNRFFWCNIVAMLVVAVLLLVGTLKGLDMYTRHGEALLVPDVNGLTVEEAANRFREAGMQAVVTDSSYVKEKPAGVVLDQNPAAGKRVKEGRRVYLTINTNSVPMVSVPDVADNSSLRQAEAKLIAAGFRLTEVEWRPGEKDWVYGVKYNMRELGIGEQVPRGALLTLLVGDGTEELPSDSLQTDSIVTIEQTDMDSESVLDDSWF